MADKLTFAKEFSLEQGSLPGVTDDEKCKSKPVAVEVAYEAPQRPYPGMLPEDLDRFADTPFWKTFRTVSTVLFFVLWLSLWIAAVVLVIIYPRCAKAPIQGWWAKSNFYHVFVPSFQDTNSDGIGDIRGVESRLEEISYLGVDTLILSPIFQQKMVPMERFAEDSITDFDQIDERLGNESDVSSLMESARWKGIRVILEFPINHVGKGHPWFGKSSRKEPLFSNFFLWSEKKTNNWLSDSNTSAWTRDGQRNEFYYHSGEPSQPDLNWRSGIVRELVFRSVSHWLDKGFDGILVPRASKLVEDYDMRNESQKAVGEFTSDIPETIDVVKRLRSFIHDKNDSKLLAIEVDSSIQALDHYTVADLVIPRKFGSILNFNTCNTTCLWQSIKEVTESSATTANLLADRRVQNRLSVAFENPNLPLLVSSVLPGSLVTLYGDEVGLNGVLSPMRWNDEHNFGFTNASAPWTSVEPGQSYDTAKKQYNSTLKIFSALLRLRKTNPSLQYGKLALVSAKNSVLGLRRDFDGVKSFLLLINFGNSDYTSTQLDLKNIEDVPDTIELVIDTSKTFDLSLKPTKINKKDIKLDAGQGILMQWDYIIKENL